MFYGDGISRNFDGSHIETPIVPNIPIESNWVRPESVERLIDRVHPIEQGPLAEEMARARSKKLEIWRRFFAGEEIAEEERGKILTALRQWSDSVPTYQSPASTWRKELARIKFQVEKELKSCAWLDNDPRTVLAAMAQEVGLALAAKSGLEFKLKTLTEEIERNAGEINAEENHRRDMRLLWDLATAIVKAPASFSDEFAYLLPPSTVERIERNRQLIRGEAERAEKERAAERLKQIQQEEYEKIESLAAVESATLEELLFDVFSYDVGSSVRQGIESRALTAAQFDELAGLRETADPVRRRAVERLIEIGAEIMRGIALKPPPTLEEIEAARQARLLEEGEAKQREIEARIEAMDSWAYPQICAEVNRLNLAPLEWVDLLPRVTDITRVTQFKQFFIEQAPRQEDPLRRRVCELMIRHLGKRF